MLKKYLLVLALGLVLPTAGYALGIRLFDHDAFATARGDAFVATADNPASIYYNPAGITLLEGHNARAGFNLVNVTSEFEGDAGINAETGSEFLPLPGFFYTYGHSNCPISLGFGYYMPFGLSLEWPGSGPFRTITTHGELQYHTFNPVIAWKITKTLSIAAGPTWNYSSTDLQRGLFVPHDQFRFTGTDWDLGANAGLLWQPFTKHSFGVSYRSETTMNYEGKSRVRPYPVPTQDASAKVPFPQVIVAGYSFRPTPLWNLEVDVDWTDWNRVNTPVLKQASGDVPLPLRWESSYAIEAGVTRYFDNGMHVSAGYVYLMNSVPEKSFTPLVPDQDLHVFSAGVGGQNNRITWDATYQFSYGAGRDISNSLYGAAVAGNYNFIAHAFSISLGYRF